MKHTICFGEVLVDLLSNKLSQNSNEHEAFTKFAGGAPANVSVAIAKLGGNAYFAGMLSTDSFGDFLHNALKEQGVKTDFMRFTDHAKTALAFVSLDNDGDRTFEFYRDNTADLHFSNNDFSSEWFEQCDIFHICSNTLTDENIRNTTAYGVKFAKQNNSIVSFDINLRLNLWPSNANPREHILPLLKDCSIIKASKEELEYLAGEQSSDEFIAQTLSNGCELFVVTDASNPMYWFTKHGKQMLIPKKVTMVDATAAGDAFVGGLLYQLGLQALTPVSFSTLCENNSKLNTIFEFASLCGAHAASYKGAFNSLPNEKSLNDFRSAL
ncbi:carbohydrate kinase [Pseudoalteromonas sp. NZS127_1]|uniref:carbohydrate kinase family protein n=1 Tax=unclassified Pseudoalteromonas TaxID=194690 RepID=UPI0018CCF0B0|nr:MULTISPECIES: carbohydrate kinase [unclassified Pseudoalteromonas]MBG9994939.1 carbohydrate kinase [Pseudoalteromonas sp. NZS127_1]MBH0042464.1 carbohydrate kinase [Pseudoalteromonas sp. SWXJZ10B]